MGYEKKRVKYEKSPLIEVMFQLRYPTILSIGSNNPIKFQDKIRSLYPYYMDQVEEVGNLMVDPRTKTASMQKVGESKNYAFISEDKKTKINLTPSFLSISTKAYNQWEDFIKCIYYVVPIFEKIYKPSFYSRLGLRYIDAITRENLGLENKKWTELIKPHVLGMVNEEYESGVRTYQSEVEYKVNIENIMSKAHFEFVRINDNKAVSLLIDCDYYVKEIIQIEQAREQAEKLHQASSMFIQKAIMPELHWAMKPVEI